MILEELGSLVNKQKEIFIEEANDNDVAIIGVAANLPLADDVEQFWNLLQTGTDMIRELPESRRRDLEIYQTSISETLNETKYPLASYLDKIDTFDYSFFNMSPRQAALTDPHHRIFLEMAWKAIEDAGYGGNKLVGKNVGVYAGFNARMEYKKLIEELDSDALSEALIGNLPSTLASLISHHLDLKGPNMVINTSCSSSLVAVHVALQAIRNKECSMALVGGIRLSILPHEDLRNSDIGIVSSSGRAMVFDDDSDGTGGGEGCVVMLLKPLSLAIEDRDNIYAVIKGSAINNDGRSASFSSPNSIAQKEVIKKAWEDAGVDPTSIDYIEAHGTGTKLGDPIEIQGIKEAFNYFTNHKQFCAVGSVKTNMGHLDTAAGIAGLLKAILSLKKQKIPPNIHFKSPNRNIDFEDSPLFVNDTLIPWEESESPRRCGVTSLGLSGTNAHVILEEAPLLREEERLHFSNYHLLTLSCRTKSALIRLLGMYSSLLRSEKTINLDDLCFTANTGRGHYSNCIAIVFKDTSDLLFKLNLLESTEWEEIKSDEVIFRDSNLQAYQDKLLDFRIKELLLEGTTRGALIEIAKMYISGHEIPWELLYEGKGFQRISLPTYPFEPERCWITGNNNNLSRLNRDYSKKLLEHVEVNHTKDITIIGGSGEKYTDQEFVIGKVWGEILGYDTININEDFYRIGGDSIQALKIVNIINKKLNTNLEVSDLLKNPTIYQLAQRVVNMNNHQFKRITTAPRLKHYPLSSAQKRLYLIGHLEGANIKYNMPNTAILEGELDIERFRNAYAALLKRHEVLRTSFGFVDGKPVQTIQSKVVPEVSYVEMEGESLDQILADFVKPFNLSEAPLIRMKVVKVSESKHILIYDIHHIIFDGISIGLIVKDLLTLYEGKSLPPLAIQYKDFAWWHNNRLKSEELKKQEAYWLNVFQGNIPVTRIPADKLLPTKRNYTAETIRFYLGKERTLALKRVATESDSTLYMILLSVFSLLVSNYTDQEDIVIGSPISGRNHPDLEPLIGVFINVLAMRIDTTGSFTFEELLLKVKEIALQAYENQEYPFEELVDKLKIKRDVNSHPLFNIMFALHSDLNEGTDISQQLKIKESGHEMNTATYDLTLDAVETEEGLTFNLVYSAELYQKETMKQFVQHFCNLITEVVAAPNTVIRDIPMLSHSEKKRIVEEFNPKRIPVKGRTATQLLTQSLREHGERTAIICRDGRLTYSELDRKSDQVAQILRRKGLVKEKVVGILLPRSSDLFVAILGIMKAGGAYLPIDPEYPKSRITYMIEHSEASFLLTDRNIGDDVKFQGEILRVDEIGQGIDTEENVVLVEESAPQDLAYVIYTSGSTGTPKGVMVEQIALCNFLEGLASSVKFDKGQKIAALTTISFDIFVVETLLPLTQGMEVVLADEEDQRVPERLNQLLIEHQVDVVQATPSRLRLMLEQKNGEALLRQIVTLMVGGESFPEDLMRRLKSIYSGKLYNLYGPTETTVWSAVKDMTESDSITIGRPLNNTEIYIMGSNLQVKPVGCTGDLYIGGRGLARGYLGEFAQTKERFIKHPYRSEERLYFTGDKARWLANGEIEFIGRSDNQIKFNGFRIEAGEIEEKLKLYKEIKEAIVKKWETETGEYLCAYIRVEQEVDTLVVKSYLREVLPYYMVPSVIVQMKQFPYTPNGKVDRKALLKPTSAMFLTANYREAENELEKEVGELWQKILKLERIGVDDNFFDLGGNSIMLVQMHQQLERRYPGVIDVTELFGYTTVSQIAKKINAHQGKENVKELKSVNLPTEYFVFKYSINPTGVMSYRLDSALYEAICRGAERMGMKTEELFLSMYVFLLSNLSESKNIHMTAAINSDSTFSVLNIDPWRKIENRKGLNELVEQVREKLASAGKIRSEEITQMRLVKGEHEVITLFKMSQMGLKPSLATVYDLQMEVSERQKVLEISIEYNNRLLSEEKMKTLLSGYVNLLASLSKLLLS